MPKPYKLYSTRPIPPGAKIVQHDGKPHARLRDDRGRAILCPLTKDSTKCLRPSKRWYFDLPGRGRVKGFTDLKATEQLAGESERKASRMRAGLIDPAEEHARRPLCEHLTDYAAALEQKGDTSGHVKKTVALISAMFTGAGFVFLHEVDAAKTAEWLNALRRDALPVELPVGVECFTPRAAAALLCITTKAVGKNLKRRGLTGTGQGKKRRIARAAVETLALAAARGAGPQQCNHYVRTAKGFTRWLTRTGRIGANPLETLTLLNTAVDVRHSRRELSADELRHLFTATRQTSRAFRGLTGPDRFALYLVAAATGFRANAVSNLTPDDFDLESSSPTVTTAARFAKNRRTKVQPLPTDVAAVLRGYLAGKPAAAPIWGGTWRGKAAEMLRADLEAASIPYAVEGPDGPEHADFHALRHSFLTLGGRSGIDLRTLQELAGHSTPLLTARYMHVRLRDVAGAVEKMPNLVPNLGPNANAAALPPSHDWHQRTEWGQTCPFGRSAGRSNRGHGFTSVGIVLHSSD
jgi:integrase